MIVWKRGAARVLGAVSWESGELPGRQGQQRGQQHGQHHGQRHGKAGSCLAERGSNMGQQQGRECLAAVVLGVLLGM